MVETPRPFKIHANSHAIYPPPTIKILFGFSERSKISLEVMTCSFPITFGTNGLPPVAISMYFAVITSPDVRIIVLLFFKCAREL